MLRCISRFLLAAVVLLAVALEARSAEFIDLAPGHVGQAWGISSDGATVVGWNALCGCGPPSGVLPRPFRWTLATGHEPLEPLEFTVSEALDVSDDGSVIVGFGTASEYRPALRWTAAGRTDLGDLPGGESESRALGVSANGAVVVGFGHSSDGREAFRWTEATGMVGLGDLAGGGFDSSATDISADGSIIVGGASSAAGPEAFRWTEAAGMVGLGDLPGGAFRSVARAVSADGSTIVGSGLADFKVEAFRWTEAMAMQGLSGSEFSRNLVFSEALDVSADGAVIVGTSARGVIVGDQSWSGHANTAFTWDAVHGMRGLQSVLEEEHGLADRLAGWTLAAATAVSDDGRTIAGWGFLDAFHVFPYGVIDLEDLNNVRNNFGARGEGVLGEHTQDGVVDLNDLNYVRNNFGRTLAPPAIPWVVVLDSPLAPVPEPSTFALMALALAGMMAVAARRLSARRRSA